MTKYRRKMISCYLWAIVELACAMVAGYRLSHHITTSVITSEVTYGGGVLFFLVAMTMAAYYSDKEHKNAK